MRGIHIPAAGAAPAPAAPAAAAAGAAAAPPAGTEANLERPVDKGKIIFLALFHVRHLEIFKAC